MDETHKKFFAEVAEQLDDWVETTARAATDPSSDLVWTETPSAFRVLQQTVVTPEQQAALRSVLLQGMSGLLHSIFVTFDGGTQLAEKFTIRLQTSKGETLGPGLHELFYHYLRIIADKNQA